MAGAPATQSLKVWLLSPWTLLDSFGLRNADGETVISAWSQGMEQLERSEPLLIMSFRSHMQTDNVDLFAHLVHHKCIPWGVYTYSVSKDLVTFLY